MLTGVLMAVGRREAMLHWRALHLTRLKNHRALKISGEIETGLLARHPVWRGRMRVEVTVRPRSIAWRAILRVGRIRILWPVWRRRNLAVSCTCSIWIAIRGWSCGPRDESCWIVSTVGRPSLKVVVAVTALFPSIRFLSS